MSERQITELLNEVTKIVKKENRSAEVKISYHLIIRGCSVSWLIDTNGDLQQFSSKNQSTVRADMSLTYQSADVFFQLVRGELKGHSAVLTGKLSFTGDLKNLKLLAEWFYQAQNSIAKYANGALEQEANSKVPIFIHRSNWQSDDFAETCSVCEAKFNIYRRKHHCRVCGLVCCASCSIRKLKGFRCCDTCFYNIATQRATQSRDDSCSTDAGAEAEKDVTSSIESSELIKLMIDRIESLELELKENDRNNYSFKANILLLVLNIVHGIYFLLINLTALYIFHLISLALETQCSNEVQFYRFLSRLWDRFHTFKSASSRKPFKTFDDEIICNPNMYANLNSSILQWPLEFLEQDHIIEAESERANLYLYRISFIILSSALIGYQLYTKFCWQRRLRTFLAAIFITAILMITRRRARSMNERDSDKSWQSVHKLLAPFLYHCIIRLKGLWVKFGQFVSSRSDIMPLPFIEELGKLQDSIPASDFSRIKRTVEKELGKPMEELFGFIDRNALASASVAQVHKGKLKDGTLIVVKVQHDEVQQLMLSDLKDIMTIATVVAFLEKQFDFRPIFQEWTREVRKELDFKCEADNLVCLRQAMHESKLDVKIPKLIPQFTSTKVIVMEFCEGFKVTDTSEMDNFNLDRLSIMESVCNSFAYQVHILGRFNADPHPGNILIEKYVNENGVLKARPVLLDWGLAKNLPEYLRLSFSKFVYSAKEMDFVLMLESLDDMGLKLNRFDPMEDMLNIRFLMRDTAPPDQSRAEALKYKKLIEKRFSAGKRNPTEAFPGELLFFLRVTTLLHGLGSRLHVNAKYLEYMAPAAKTALRTIVPKHEWIKCSIYPYPVLSPLEEKVRKYLEHLIESGEVRGCQVSVFENGREIVNTCCGEQGQLDPRPVTGSTLFCVFSVGKIVTAMCLHKLVDQKKVTYDTKVSTFWPEFGVNGKEDTTIRHILTHSAGLQHILPDKPTMHDFCNWNKMLQVLEAAAPLWIPELPEFTSNKSFVPGSRSVYHYFTFGWLVGGCVEKITKRKFSDFMREEILTPLGLQDAGYMGDLKKLQVGSERIAGMEMEIPKGTLGDDEDIMAAEEAECDSKIAGENSDRDFAKPKSFLHLMADALKSEDPIEGVAIENLANKLTRREYLLDPRLFNSKEIREGCIPSANGLFTAHALARIHNDLLISLGAVNSPDRAYSPILSRECVEAFRKYSASDSSAAHRLFGMQNRIRFGLGCQLFGFKESSQRVRLSGFGHVGMGGSVAFCDPAHGVSFAMTVNKIVPGRKPTVNIVSMVCEELRMGKPTQLFSS